VDCRYRQAQAINAAYTAHRIDRATAEAQMALVRQRAAKDVALARLINQQIQDRGGQFGVAASNVDPGAAAAISARPAAQSQPAVVRSAAAIKLRPDAGAPDVAQLKPHEQVTVSPGRNGYALVQTSNGQQGYVSASSLQGNGGRGISVATTTPIQTSSDVRTLAGSNAARRDDFAQSVSVTEQAQSSGFELSSS
jgi:hypothetical protein